MHYKQRVRTRSAASYVGLSVSTLAKLRISGEGPCFIKLGRAVVYDIDDLDAWVEARKRRSTSEIPDDA